MPLPLPPSFVCRRLAPALAASAALLLGGCGMTRPSPAIPKPPLLALPDEPAPAPAAAVQAPAAQHTTVQALLARSDVSVRLIDAGRAQDLWAWVAPFLQATGERDRILADIARTRAALGPVQGRSRAGAQGVQAVRLGPQSRMPPPGQYANVEYAVQLANGASGIERLSFRQESDGWRFTGYTAQVLPAASPGSAPAAGR